MSKHTPGPWNANNSKSDPLDKACAVWTKDSDTFICSGRFPNGSRDANEDAMHANMLLIASAPDLLSALENLRNEAVGYLADLNRHGVDTTTLRGAIKQAEAVIAKAK